jgi:hypothetical protein
MMVERFECDMCGAETAFSINGTFYCGEHAYEGIGIQARLVAVLRDADSDAVRAMGEWAQREVATMFRIPPHE